eukprot:TRINITY_DN5068_c0_g1_i2.p1 TRINITY_DN5068_c0_g1~~TRINITY_DN5068_c0_g1_i2.p1  ORF type:complete len:272 (-),score=33.58 TRINITY_DN5068_c0_g1_i2:90-905(-)
MVSVESEKGLVVGKTWRGVQIVESHCVQGKCGVRGLLLISRGSVIDFTGDAIVNAANEGCITGGGVDGAITSAGGTALAKARRDLPIVEGTEGVRCPTGEARITIGGDLRAAWCIHAVGPNYNVQMAAHNLSLKECDAIVASAYASSMKVAKENGIKTIAFSLLSAGIFRGEQSLKKVLEQGVIAVVEEWYDGLEEVHFVAFTSAEARNLGEVCAEIFTPTTMDKPEGEVASTEASVEPGKSPLSDKTSQKPLKTPGFPAASRASEKCNLQ